MVAPSNRLLARAPRRTDHVVVQRRDTQRVAGSVTKDVSRALQLLLLDPTRLVPPRAHRVEADRDDVLGAVHRLRRLPLTLELRERAREARRECVRDVVVARDAEEWLFER